VNQRLRVEDVDSPLCEVRPVKSVLLVVLTGDRGLCGGYNNFIIKRVRQKTAPGGGGGQALPVAAGGRESSLDGQGEGGQSE
jgi:F-type H+-transporting ATPase subunit gamma